jgi:hypothetical protein
LGRCLAGRVFSAGHPPARADGGELTHGELPLSEPDATHAITAAVKEGGWAELPDELLVKVLELLQAAGQAGGLGFSQVMHLCALGGRSCTMRL